MISLKNVNKYYNKSKSNEIHVIDNTTVDFPETGLVALTGPSGCGKTTLLNVIGGLDSFASGEIVFNNKTIRRYKPLEWDIIRNEKVGYIFQNYNLVLSKTVYENIELALNMAGLYDKKQIEERVNYVLESVGMYNYRKRNVRALSGGQQQRVAIARALAKDPEVVLADEPTGNLDTNNTFEIMSIIKKISETRLVILVTHERGLVDFYADRIIELSDGKIVDDYANSGGGSMDHVDDRNIYLKDLQFDEGLKESGIDYYYDAEKDPSLNIKLVEVKGNLFIKVKSKRKIKFIDESSEVKLIDDHYRKREVTDLKDYHFDLTQFKKIENPKIKKSFIKWPHAIKNGFTRIFSQKKVIGKLFLLGYFIISALVVFQLASFGSLTYIDERDILTGPRDLLTLDLNKDMSDDVLRTVLDNVEGISFSPYFSTPGMRLKYTDFYQGQAQIYMSAYPVKLSYYQNVTITHGRLPEKSYEVVIDEWVADRIMEEKRIKDLNVTEYEELIDAVITSDNWYNQLVFTIVGIVKTQSPIIIMQDAALFGFYENYYLPDATPYGSVSERIKITAGREIQNDDEVLLPSYSGYNLGDTYEFWDIYDDKTVVGFYEPNDTDYKISNNGIPIISNKTYEDAVVYSSPLIYQGYYYGGFRFYAEDHQQAIEDFAALDLILYNSYQAERLLFEERLSAENASRISQIAVIIGGIIIYIFFMMRSSMLNRIKEIGVYRAIGATKRDIYKIFFSEIITLTTVGSLTSYLLMSYVVNQIQAQLEGLTRVFYFPLYLFVGGILSIYALNIVFGMLPIFTLLRKTPAEIISKYDI